MYKIYSPIIFVFLITLLPVTLLGQILTAPDATTVTISRDDYGVPHVSAESEIGVFFGQGFAIAADRLYQMEMFRRMGEGSAAEVLGSFLVDYDKEIRLTGYTQAERSEMYANASTEFQVALQAYSDGVNTYIDSMEANPAIYKPQQFANLPMEEWTVEKSIACITLLGRIFGMFGGEELDRLVELQNNGQEWFDLNRPINDPDSPTTIRDITTGSADFIDWRYSGRTINEDLVDSWNERKEMVALTRFENGVPAKFGSFAAIISPERAIGGNSMLLGCPQMGAPSATSANTICEVELDFPGFHVGGMTIAGIPGVVIGRNDNIAWTFTSGISDNVDVYIDSTETTEMGSYLYNDQFQEFEVITETIHVAGGDDQIFTHYRTIHGPVFLDDLNNQHVYTAKMAFWKDEIGFFELLRDVWVAEDRDDFADALTDSPLSFNIFFADNSGDIAYWHVGRYNDRLDAIDPRLPHFGDGTEEMIGYREFTDLPFADATSEPFYLNWNNKPVIWWDNGDNIAWSGSTHRVENMFNLYDPISSLFALDFLINTPNEINDHGTWQQAIDWSDTETAVNICPPGQSDFVSLSGVPSPHKSDQWGLHTTWQFKPWEYDYQGSSVSQPRSELPERFRIESIYPNPFNPSTTITLHLPERDNVRVEVYNIMGRLISTLADREYSAGIHRLIFEASKVTSHASGVYFIHATSGQNVKQIRKVVLMK
jgi:penicillin G amidase